MDAAQIYVKELENKNSTQENTIVLMTKARNGDERAKNELIENYLLLVVKIARQYINMGVPLEDLIQEGNSGLMVAYEKYDITNGAPFGSYSKFWIKQSIIRNCMHKKRMVRLPENISELLRTDRWKGQDYKEFSIDVPYEDGGSFSDSLADEENDSYAQSEETMIINKKIEGILSFLKKRDAEVVKAIHGIGMVKPLDIEEAANAFSLTTTRINQILRNSLNTLRESQTKPIKKGALTIISATYGTESNSICVIDVINEMISNNDCIKSSNKLGGDPAKGVAKHLFLQYSLDGQRYVRRFSEGSYVKF